VGQSTRSPSGTWSRPFHADYPPEA
jgi:hypothetical protein